MPLPFIIAGGLAVKIAAGAAAAAGIGVAAHKIGKSKGYSEGYDDAEELTSGQINEYKKSSRKCRKKGNRPKKVSKPLWMT